MVAIFYPGLNVLSQYMHSGYDWIVVACQPRETWEMIREKLEIK